MIEQRMDQEYLKSRLLYSPKRGKFYWILPPKNKANLLGEEAGVEAVANNKKYYTIQIDGKKYKRGRLAYLYMTGEWPVEMIDHIDGDGTNDRWENLRSATVSENAFNHKSRAKKSSLPMGVRETGIGRYCARIGVNKRLITIGTFGTISEAKEAYQNARKVYYGEFA